MLTRILILSFLGYREKTLTFQDFPFKSRITHSQILSGDSMSCIKELKIK